MKTQIRQGVFETNSSSVHSITMVGGDEYAAWRKGELLFYPDYRYDKKNKKFLSIEEGIEWNISNISYFKDAPKEFTDSYRETKNLRDAFDYCEENNISISFDYDDLYLGEMYISYSEYDDMLEDRCVEDFVDEYTTNGGEKVVAFGYYGQD